MSDDKPEMEHASNNGVRLFDDVIHTDSGYKRRDESDFECLNRLAWVSVEIGRGTLESWFARFPEEKKLDIRGRFQGDDREHQGALLELATHEILCAVGSNVQVEPDIDGRRPDFAVTYKGATIVVECTVAQESDDDFNATNRENTIKKAVNDIDTEPFALFWRRLSPGCDQPPTRQLCNEIRNWVSSLNADEELRRLRQGHEPREMEFVFGNGWKLRLGAVIFGSGKHREHGAGAISLEVGRGGGFRRDDVRLKRALEKKADRYRSLTSPYVVVVGSGIVFPDLSDMLKALFGRTELRGELTKTPDCLLLSPSGQPKNRHVSAVLYKPGFGGLWTICGTENPWQLVHNPWANAPLPSGMFTFATEWVLESTGFVDIKPTRTMNSVLGLPDPWPGMEH